MTSEPQPNTQLDQTLAELEEAFGTLQKRFEQVKRDRATQAQLLERQAELEAGDPPSYPEELQQIQKDLEVIEVNLESHLFKWSTLKEPFWQAVRFGGLGVVLGWFLKSLQ
jgi:iron-sulfur cluster repair protein YtfE (RIC family)